MSDASHIQIHVHTYYLASHSDPSHQQYQFAYTITIRNLGTEPVKLLERYWLITDGNQQQTEVKGEGVVGKQPLIAAGDEHQYTSGVMLETAVGTMQGYYLMSDASGSTFNADIPVFRLAVATLLH